MPVVPSALAVKNNTVGPPLPAPLRLSLKGPDTWYTLSLTPQSEPWGPDLGHFLNCFPSSQLVPARAV